MRSLVFLALCVSAMCQNIWTTPTILASGSQFGALASSGNTVHFVYQTNKRGKIDYRRSLDGGNTWSSPVTIGAATEIPLDRAMAADGQSVYLAYDRNNTLYLRKSSDSGSTWGAERVMYVGLPNYFFRITVATANGAVHLIITNDSSIDFSSTGLFYTRSLDGGSTWEPIRQLALAGLNPARPAMALHGSFVHITWSDERDGAPPCYTSPACPEIYYARSLDGGATWEADRRITFTNGDTCGRPDVTALDDGEVILSWQDDHNVDGQEDVYTDHSFDNGATFDGPVQQTFAPLASEHATITSLGSFVSLAWFDRRDGNEEIYYKESADGGLNWGPEQRLTNTPADSNVPRITTTTDGRIHIVWNEGGSTFEYIHSQL